MQEKQLKIYREDLLGLRREILKQVEEEKIKSSAEALSETGDEMDLASEQRERELYHIMGERDKAKLNDIQKAIERIDSGEFGICEDCGEEISEKRLKAVPYSTLCVDCKEKQEIEMKNAQDRADGVEMTDLLDDI